MDGSVRESRKSWARVVFYVKNKNLDLVRRDRSLVAFSKRFDETSPLNDTMNPSPCFTIFLRRVVQYISWHR